MIFFSHPRPLSRKNPRPSGGRVESWLAAASGALSEGRDRCKSFLNSAVDTCEDRGGRPVQHIVVREPKNLDLEFFVENLLSFPVAFAPLGQLVNSSVKLDRKPRLRTIKVQNEMTRRNLALNLVAETSPVPNECPEPLLRWSGVLAKLSRSRRHIFVGRKVSHLIFYNG